jgi:hypothetical protein
VNVHLGVNSRTTSLHLPAGKKVALSQLHFHNMLQHLLCRLVVGYHISNEHVENSGCCVKRLNDF